MKTVHHSFTSLAAHGDVNGLSMFPNVWARHVQAVYSKVITVQMIPPQIYRGSSFYVRCMKGKSVGKKGKMIKKRKVQQHSCPWGLTRQEHLKPRHFPKLGSRLPHQPKWMTPIAVIFFAKTCSWTKLTTCNWILSSSMCSVAIIGNKANCFTTRGDNTNFTSKFFFYVQRKNLQQPWSFFSTWEFKNLVHTATTCMPNALTSRFKVLLP